MESLNKKIKISVKNLSMNYKDVEALDNVSFDIYDGEFLAILGPSGCGKSTLIKILMGLLMPTNGHIYMNGEDITNNKPSDRKMGIVFQNYALFENMNVVQNVSYGLKYRKDIENKDDIVKKIIEAVGLTDYEKSKPNNLSGGQQQRVAIARTLAVNPDVILFDEPMSALDITTRVELRKQIKDLQKKFNTTIVYITHDQEEAFSLADRIMVMGKGCVHQIDNPKEILNNPSDSYVKEFVVDNLVAKKIELNSYFSN